MRFRRQSQYTPFVQRRKTKVEARGKYLLHYEVNEEEGSDRCCEGKQDEDENKDSGPAASRLIGLSNAEGVDEGIGKEI